MYMPHGLISAWHKFQNTKRRLLTLKEGLTVYRDQEFSGDMMNSHAVKRIEDVRSLRAGQFAEDAGPMSHPIRPKSYISMDNFYTATVYSKGAKVIRMYRNLLGKDGFRKGMDLYFERHDGNAVTCDDFLSAMADANGVDLSQFGRWYSTNGTPTVKYNSKYDEETKTFSLTLSQESNSDEALHIPVAVGLLDKVSGKEVVPMRVARIDAPIRPATRVRGANFSPTVANANSVPFATKDAVRGSSSRRLRRRGEN